MGQYLNKALISAEDEMKRDGRMSTSLWSISSWPLLKHPSREIKQLPSVELGISRELYCIQTPCGHEWGRISLREP